MYALMTQPHDGHISTLRPASSQLQLCFQKPDQNMEVTKPHKLASFGRDVDLDQAVVGSKLECAKHTDIQATDHTR